MKDSPYFKQAELMLRAIPHDEKTFLVSLKAGQPNWGVMGIEEIEKLPAIQWSWRIFGKLAQKSVPSCWTSSKERSGCRPSVLSDFTVDSYKVEGKDPLVIRFLGERITYVGRTETERKAYQYRITLRHVERTQQNPYGLVVTSVEQTEPQAESAAGGKPGR